ncbi:MAG: RNA-binding protein [Burkholderiales bacterium]
MTPFELTPDMLTLGGVFYPKGYAFILFARLEDAEQVAHEIDCVIDSNSDDSGTVSLLGAETILRDIGKVNGESDVVLPSVGTEGATVQKYVSLARQGHCALLIHMGNSEKAERVMQAVHKVPFAYGQRYHLLAIEDLV